MIDFRRANMEDLSSIYLESTGAREALNLVIRRQDSKSTRELDILLRSHRVDPVVETTEIEWRDNFNALLEFISVLETAVIANYIAVDPIDSLWGNVKLVLSNKAVQRYYSKHYPLVLPQMLRTRLVKGRGIEPVGGAESRDLFQRFIRLDLMFSMQLRRKVFMRLLDDVSFGEIGFNEFLAVLDDPSEVMQRFLRIDHSDAILDEALHQFGHFLRFCNELYLLLEAAQTSKVLQSAIWHNYAYWFGIRGKVLRERIDDSLLKFVEWKTRSASNYVEVLLPALQWTRDAFDELTSSRYAEELENRRPAETQLGRPTVWQLRTLALVGHGGSGKTTLTEALLARSGAIETPGTIERGTTVCDYDPLEKTLGHSLNASLVNFAWGDTHIHLIDTPGYPDFAGQSIGPLAAVETALVVINAQTGIELNTRRMMKWAQARGLCRMIVVNKIDADNVDLPAILATIQQTFGKECLPVNLPARGGKDVVDCFFNTDGDADFSSVKAAHAALVDQVVAGDEGLMTLYREQGEINRDQLHAQFKKMLREGRVIPVCFTSAKDGLGVRKLLDVLAKLAPNPAEGNPASFLKGEGERAEEFHVEPDPAKHVLAHVFKVVIDPFVGKLGVFRVHQGTVKRDSQLFVGNATRPFRVAHLYLLQGKAYVETDALVPGDIGAVSNVEEIEFDSVLHDSHDEDYIHLRPLEFPAPMHGLAVQAKKKGDEQRLFESLHKMELEDPCFRMDRHPSTNETVIRALGDLHLRTKLEKLTSQYKLELVTRPPRIPYRETITRKAKGHSRHKKQTGGAGQFGEVYLRIEPLPRGAGYEFVDQVKGGVIPTVFIPAVEKGVRMALDAGVIAGYPVEDLRVIVYDGKSHPVDSKEIAFISAGRKAIIDAFSKAAPIMLEPIVNIEIDAPQAYVGDMTSVITSKRGQITRTHRSWANLISTSGLVPLAELSDFQNRLRSITGGQGSYSVEFSHYERIPPILQKKLTGKKKVQEDD